MHKLLTPVLLAGLCSAFTACQSGIFAKTPTTLRDASEGLFEIGVALPTRVLNDKPAAEIAAREFNRVTAENEMKWESLQPREGQFTFEKGDALVAFAEKNNMKVHGHTLLWHAQTPQWVFQGPNGTRAGRELVLKRLKDHINAVLSHYKGKIESWDVVNECYNQDGSLRYSPWRSAIGDDYIEQAFRFAAEADPNIILCYNDYDMPHAGKRDAIVKLVKDLKAKGVKIDGIGLQTHWNVDWPTMENAEKALSAFAGTGCKIIISEMDINTRAGMRNSGAGLVRTGEGGQSELVDPNDALAKRYGQLFDLFVKYRKNIHAVTLWGIADHYSWIHGEPLLFDKDLKAKPAYDAVLQSLIRGQKEANSFF